MTLGELYGFIVYNCKIEPQYFLDEMSPDEVSYLSDAYQKEYKERWEMLRLSNYAVYSTQSTKPIKLEDVMTFPWEKTGKSKPGTDKKKETPEETKKRIMKRFNIKT